MTSHLAHWSKVWLLHLFSSKQRRTFDLTAIGPLSRYLLIKKFVNGAYDNEILFGPNVLTRQIKVQNDAQGEGILMFDYQNCGFTFDVGYTLWGKTKDKITILTQFQATRMAYRVIPQLIVLTHQSIQLKA